MSDPAVTIGPYIPGPPPPTRPRGWWVDRLGYDPFDERNGRDDVSVPIYRSTPDGWRVVESYHSMLQPSEHQMLVQRENGEQALVVYEPQHQLLYEKLQRQQEHKQYDAYRLQKMKFPPYTAFYLKSADNRYYLAYRGFGKVDVRKRPYVWRTNGDGMFKYAPMITILQSASRNDNMYFVGNKDTNKILSVMVEDNHNKKCKDGSPCVNFSNLDSNIPFPILLTPTSSSAFWDQQEDEAAAAPPKKACSIM